MYHIDIQVYIKISRCNFLTLANYRQIKLKPILEHNAYTFWQFVDQVL